MKNRSPAFQFYPDDWNNDMNVIVMSPEEEGHYIRLLGICWKEGSLPSNPEDIQLLLKKPCENLDKILKCFLKNPKNNSQLYHKRLEKERKKQREFRRKKSSAGKKGADSRWKNKGLKGNKDNGTAMVLPLANDSSISLVSDSDSVSISKSKDLKDISEKNKSNPKDPELQNLWDCTLEAVESQIPADDFKRWFLSSHVKSLLDGNLVVTVPNQNNRKALIEKYRGMIEDVVEIIEGKRIIVDFSVEK